VLDAPEVLPPALDIAYLEGRRVLLVDDVADSGRTLALAVALLRDRGADVRSVTVYTKPGSIATPDYSWRETDLWIDFPWSWQGTVTLDGSVGAEGA
jgi:hypoxanthine phosphoribosyltransferase